MSALLVVLVLANVTLGLAFEWLGTKNHWPWAEALVGVITTAHFTYWMFRLPKFQGATVSRRTLLICLTLATIGELILSAVLVLYTYRVSTLPFFVPPGHVLLFLAGVALTDLFSLGRSFVIAVPAIALAFLLPRWFEGIDLISIPLFLIFTVCLRYGRDKSLYAVMFILALLLELLGTWFQTWTWQPYARALSISSANPPLAAGVFYALLDLLTMAMTQLFKSSTSSLAAQNVEASSISSSSEERHAAGFE